MLKLVCQLIIVSTFIGCTGCASMLRTDGPYKGKVIDAETGKPIEGAVVNGTWYKLHATPGGAVGEYYDSYEVLTDKDGEFSIPGKGLLVLSRIDEMGVTIFKAGYKQWTKVSWRAIRIGKWPNEEAVWQGDKGILKLKKLTLEERRRSGPEEPDGPADKQRLWRMERNKEMIEIGRSADTLLPLE